MSDGMLLLAFAGVLVSSASLVAAVRSFSAQRNRKSSLFELNKELSQREEVTRETASF